MKAILEFNLPEDHEAFELARLGPSYSIVLETLANKVRARLKHGELKEDVATELLEMLKYIAELQHDYGIPE